MNKTTQDIHARLAEADPQPKKRITIQQHYRDEIAAWEERMGQARQVVNEVDAELKKWDQEQYTIPLSAATEKALRIRDLNIILTVHVDIANAARIKIDRLQLELQNSGREQSPRWLAYQQLREDFDAAQSYVTVLSGYSIERRASMADYTKKLQEATERANKLLEELHRDYPDFVRIDNRIEAQRKMDQATLESATQAYRSLGALVKDFEAADDERRSGAGH